MQPCSDREEMKNVAITTSDGLCQMSMLFESTVADIFRKFDMLLNRELGYSEFCGFCECVGRPTTEAEFSSLLSHFSSTKRKSSESQGGPASFSSNGGHIELDRSAGTAVKEGGLTLEGFKQFMVSEIEAAGMEEDLMFKWLESLGYD